MHLEKPKSHDNRLREEFREVICKYRKLESIIKIFNPLVGISTRVFLMGVIMDIVEIRMKLEDVLSRAIDKNYKRARLSSDDIEKIKNLKNEFSLLDLNGLDKEIIIAVKDRIFLAQKYVDFQEALDSSSFKWGYQRDGANISSRQYGIIHFKHNYYQLG